MTSRLPQQPPIAAHGRQPVLPQKFRALLVVGALAALPLATTACGDNGTAAPGTTTEAADDDYFASKEFLGREVTVSAVVTAVLGDKSFVLDGSEYGDESLLVLSADEASGMDLQEGDAVQVTGTVEDFAYANYRDEYGLIDDGVYTTYGDEEFLAARSVEANVPTATK
ncbi:MAG: hypothetical protein HOV94_29905 [Saccharothrix sp.]|nr:hypothetical protein [Saccharothrix sp.]